MKSTTYQKLELDQDDLSGLRNEIAAVLNYSGYKLANPTLLEQLCEDLATTVSEFIESKEAEYVRG